MLNDKIRENVYDIIDKHKYTCLRINNTNILKVMADKNAVYSLQTSELLQIIQDLLSISSMFKVSIRKQLLNYANELEQKKLVSTWLIPNECLMVVVHLKLVCDLVQNNNVIYDKEYKRGDLRLLISKKWLRNNLINQPLNLYCNLSKLQSDLSDDDLFHTKFESKEKKDSLKLCQIERMHTKCPSMSIPIFLNERCDNNVQSTV